MISKSAAFSDHTPPPVKSLPYRCHYRCHYYRCSAPVNLGPVNRASCQSCVLSITRPAPSAPSPIATAITMDTKPALLRPLLPLPLIPRPLLQLPLVLQPLVVVVIVRGAALSGCGQNDWLPGIYGCIKNLPAFSECFLIITLVALPLSWPLP